MRKFAVAFFAAATLAAGAAPLVVDYPKEGSIFPPEITPPTIIWRDASPAAIRWRIDVEFTDGSPALHFTVPGEPLRIGPIDPPLRLEYKRTAPPHARTGRRPHLDPVARRVVRHPAAQHRKARHPPHRRTQRQRAGLPRPRHHHHFEGSRRRAHLLSRRAPDARRNAEGRHPATGRRRHPPHPLAHPQHRGTGEPHRHREHAHLRQLPQLFGRRPHARHGSGRPAEQQGHVHPGLHPPGDVHQHQGRHRLEFRQRHAGGQDAHRLHVPGFARRPVRGHPRERPRPPTPARTPPSPTTTSPTSPTTNSSRSSIPPAACSPGTAVRPAACNPCPAPTTRATSRPAPSGAPTASILSSAAPKRRTPTPKAPRSPSTPTTPMSARSASASTASPSTTAEAAWPNPSPAPPTTA